MTTAEHWSDELWYFLWAPSYVWILNQFYPEGQLTVTSTDPQYIAQTVKAMLRRKNRLVRAVQTDEAGDLSEHIRTITRSSSKWMHRVVRVKTSKTPGRKSCVVLEMTAVTRWTVFPLKFWINNTDNSTNSDYRQPKSKLSAVDQISFISEMDVFRVLDTLPPNTTGLDGIRAWFYDSSASAAPLAQLFNQSTLEGIAHPQWTTAVINPIPKVPQPTQAANYARPQFSWPVCFPADWFDNYRGHSFASHCTHHGVQWPVCPCLLIPLHQGIWHWQAWGLDEQGGAATSQITSTTG